MGLDESESRSQSITWNIGHQRFKGVGQQFLILMEFIAFAAGPAAEVDPGSGALQDQWSITFQTGLIVKFHACRFPGVVLRCRSVTLKQREP
jgi:hypothetical protein